MKIYNNWLSSDFLSTDEKTTLSKLTPDEISDSFYTDLEFGTAGIRGIMGLGTNRFNRFVVSRTTKALADVLKNKNSQNLVVIGFDSRNSSLEFSRLCAEILASNGISVLLFSKLSPTPLISFAIRHYKATAGINITASHNPKEYNGFKVYMENGAQLDNDLASEITNHMQTLDHLVKYNTTPLETSVENGTIKFIDRETEIAFLNESKKVLCTENCSDFSLVFTPLYGTGATLVPEILSEIGVKNVFLVNSQMQPNGDFPNMSSPNPEELPVYDEAIKIASQNNSDIIIATDPDADRVGVMVRLKDGSYKLLSGNMVGCLLTDFLISRGNIPENSFVTKSIVTSNLIEKISTHSNIPCYNTFTGFRFIAELIDSLHDQNCLISLEESCGYLVGDFARDKDAITAVALISQMAMHHKNDGLTLFDALENLYNKHGFFIEKTISVLLPGASGVEKITNIMDNLHKNPLKSLNGLDVQSIDFFNTGKNFDFEKYSNLELSGSNVVRFNLKNGSQAIIRPSGTEPKVKVYIMAQGQTSLDAKNTVDTLTTFANELFI